MLAIALPGCSTLPTPTLPPFADHHVRAEFVVGADGRLAVPASGPDLVVHDLELHPTPRGEHFTATGRWFDYAPGTHVLVRARFRSYGDHAANPAHALRGATAVRAISP